MLLKLLGWFWIITGVLFLLQPELLRTKLQKKSVKKLKKWFFAIALILGLLLIKAGWGVPGLLAKIIVLLGFVGIFKAVFVLKAQASDKLINWLLEQPVQSFRMYAIGQIAFGAILLSI